MKSKKFEVGLLDQFHITIPEAVYKPFVETKQKRVKVKAFHNDKTIEFYAAVKLNKNTDEYSMMFGKRYQKS